ncbi:MAG TPA: ElyC/SanA/YdcF family protein [Terracidiphilus sp.]
MPLFKSRLFVRFLLLVSGVASVCIMAAMAGRLLVVDAPQKSDVMLVLSGDYNDVRSKHGLLLLRRGYAQQLILDAPASVMYGRRLSDAAENYLQTTARDEVGHVHVCSVISNSTQQEMREVRDCIHGIMPNAHSAIVVTSNYHTRRSLEIARRIMPQYQWAVAAAPDPDFRVDWWHSRESAKITLTEWQKLAWWDLVERWATK